LGLKKSLLEKRIISSFKREVIKQKTAKIDEQPDGQTNGEWSSVALDKFYFRNALHASCYFGKGAR
jgi:hypothetical protein